MNHCGITMPSPLPYREPHLNYIARVLVFRSTFQVPRSLATSHTGSSGDDMDHDAGEDTDIIEEQPMEVSGTTVGVLTLIATLTYIIVISIHVFQARPRVRTRQEIFFSLLGKRLNGSDLHGPDEPNLTGPRLCISPSIPRSLTRTLTPGPT